MNEFNFISMDRVQNGENLNYYVLSWDLKKQYKCRAYFFCIRSKMKKKIIVIGIVVARQFTFCFRLLKLKPLTLWLVFATCFSGISAQKTFKKLNTNFLLQIFDFQEHMKRGTS